MKKSSVSLWFLTATLFAVVALAQNNPPAKPPPPAPDASRPHQEEMLKRYDTNRDGILDDTERQAAHEALQQRQRGPGGRGNWAGPGPGGPTCACCQPMHQPGPGGRMGPPMGRQIPGMSRMMPGMHPGAGRFQLQQKLHNHFDADHNGVISADERAAAKQRMANHRDQAGQHRQEIMARFDADQNGMLDDQERTAAKQAWENFLKQYPVIKPAAGK